MVARPGATETFGFDNRGHLLSQEASDIGIWSLQRRQPVGRLAGRMLHEDASIPVRGPLFVAREPGSGEPPCPALEGWQLEPLERTLMLPGREREGRCVEPARLMASPDGDHAVLVQQNDAAELLDLRSGKVLFELVPGSVGFAPDGSVLVWSAPSDELALWFRDGGQKKVVSLDPWCAYDRGPPVFSPDARLVALPGKLGVCVFELPSGRARSNLPPNLKPQPGEWMGWFEPVEFSRDAKRLFVQTSHGGFASLYDTRSAKSLLSDSGILFTHVLARRDGSFVLVSTEALAEIDPRGKQRWVIGPEPGLPGAYAGATPDAERILLSNEAGAISHSTRTGARTAALARSEELDTPTFSPNGRWLSAGSCLWNLDDGRRVDLP